ncbi:MAG TPA: hypothetical protein ENN41_02340 [Sediminispirochaeta sp.]|nr:hypothetical protein [Sediminispirochaeta sp.]
MAEWFNFIPVDTLFLRGAESLDKGSDHRTTTIFPPTTETLSGALRTAYLIEHEIPFHLYNRSDFSDTATIDQIGRSHEEPPWSLIGPLIRKGTQLFVPSPYSWFAPRKELESYLEGKKGSLKILPAEYIQSGIIWPQRTLWVRSSSDEIECLGDKWVNIESVLKGAPVKLLSTEEVYTVEERTGIALDPRRRTVLEGHLFTMNHVRLLHDVSLLFGINKPLDIAQKGVLKVGGEQRFGRYEKIESPLSFESRGDGGRYMSLSSIDGSLDGIEGYVMATGKIIYRGGWNMREGFHKPLKGYYPAGTVLSDIPETVMANCIKMEDRK